MPRIRSSCGEDHNSFSTRVRGNHQCIVSINQFTDRKDTGLPGFDFHCEFSRRSKRSTIITIGNRKGDNGHFCDMPKCCGLGSNVCPASRRTNLRPPYIAYITAQKNRVGYRSAAEQQSGHPGKWSQMPLPSREPRIQASHVLQRKFVPTSALQQTKHLHNLGVFENRIVWAKFLRMRLLF